MKLVFLGTAASQPTENRGMSCTCLVREGEILMFDAGEGTQLAFLKARLGWNKKMRIFLTHLHGDHCIGVLGLLQTMTLQNRTEPIEIYGPKGVEDFIVSNTRVLNFGLPFPVKITSIKEGLIYEDQNYTIHACEAEHSVPTFSYLFTEKPKPGRFHPEKAKDLGIPESKLWHELQSGKEVKVGEKTVKPSDVMGKERPGKKIGISGDTRPTKKIETFFTNCDYLIFDSTFSDDIKEKAEKTFHSTAKEAAQLAKNANVSNLILSHFSARYKDESLLLDEAKTIHNSVTAARDHLEIEIK